MRIKEFISQNRRDFTAIYECEHCKHTYQGNGYDDNYFHREIVPNMECPECGKKADKETYRVFAPKYPDGYQV